MRTPVAVSLLLLGGLALVAGAVLLVVFGRYGTAALLAGSAMVLAALLLALVLPQPWGRRARVLFAALTLVVLGIWAYARYGAPLDPEPEAPTPSAAGRVSAAGSAAALARGLQMAREALARLDGHADYACTWSKRERARSLIGRVRLTDERLALKFRRLPRSVYVRYLAPEAKAGTEAIWVEGRNDGRLIAHSTRSPLDLLGTLRLAPTEWMAMIDQRYPITRMGLRTIAEEILRLVEEHAEALAACDVRLLEGQTVDGRPCHCMEVVAPGPLPGLALALARVHFDVGWGVPVRLERWDYLLEDGLREKRLVEAYTATDLRFDVGLEDEDFDPANPDYGY